MEDINKVYSKEEIRALSIRDFIKLKKEIDAIMLSVVSEKDQKLLSKYSEMLDFPYAYAHNPHYFKIGEKDLSDKREEEIEDIISEVKVIRNRMLKYIPKAVITLQNIITL